MAMFQTLGLNGRFTFRLTGFVFVAIIVAACGHRNEVKDLADLYPFSHLLEVPFNEVKIKNNFWSAKIENIQKVTIPLLLDIAKKEGKMDNFRIIAGLISGKISLHNASDSDVYKLIEAASYSLAWKRDPPPEQ